jgi:predicted AAA+ superfamily ATPase
MILESVIKDVSSQQMERLKQSDLGQIRDFNFAQDNLKTHALIITGIRRCGKSTLLHQFSNKLPANSFLYLNFDTPRLYGFHINDFSRLDNIIKNSDTRTLLFDEIQYVEAWELYIRQKLDEGYQIVLTGSNASMLSQDLGTKLTGRHISRELFPFSYKEFLKFKGTSPGVESISEYLNSGGFPEYCTNKNPETILQLFDDIITRDIISRFSIKDSGSLKRLVLYLYSNIGNRISATKLKQPLEVRATSTLLIWLSYLEQSYLVGFVPKYSHSTKAQLINPKKVYAIDTGMHKLISNNLQPDLGHRLENLIYLQLRRKYKDLYYFDQNYECDFVAIKNGRPQEIIQVCYELTPDNLDREINGLVEALSFFKMKEGLILSLNDRDQFIKDGMTIKVLPAWEWCEGEG